MIETTYDHLKNFLEKLGFQVYEQPTTVEAPYKQLTFFVADDHKQRPLYMSLVIHPVQMGEIGELLKIKNEGKKYQRIQLMTPMPFQFKQDAASELARMLMLINKSIEYPGFECSESDRIIYFKMAWALAHNELDETLLANQIYFIAGIASTFSEGIERIGNGETTLKQYLESFLEKKSPES